MQTKTVKLIDMLSPRQREIYNLKKQKFTNRQIANKLGVHRGSVTVQLERIRKKCTLYDDQIQGIQDIIKRKTAD